MLIGLRFLSQFFIMIPAMVVCEILPNIWLTDGSYAKDPVFLKKNNIRVVINCTKNIQFTNLDIQKYRLSVNDHLEKIDQDEMLEDLDQITKIMLIAFKTLTPLHIYCQAGIQRSCSVIAAFLIRYTGVNPLTAIKIIQSKHEQAFRPSVNFLPALETFSKTYNK